jgi:hypothetical protein
MFIRAVLFMQARSDVEKKPILIAVAIVIVVALLSVALWEFVLRDMFEGESTEYTISISFEGADRDDIRMSDLEGLPESSYEDVLGSGAIDSGPLVRDVILLRVDPSWSSSRAPSRSRIGH